MKILVNKIKSIFREYIKRLSRILFQNEIKRKKAMVYYYNLKAFFTPRNKEPHNIFDYKTMIKNKHNFCYEEYRANAFYGIVPNIKKYSGYNGKVHSCFEHGVYFGDFVNEKETADSGFPTIFTFGKIREKHIKDSGSEKKIFTIGPYIYYADSLLDAEQKKEWKTKMGKTLLVFPSHSVDRVTTSFDYDGFINKIEEFKCEHNFNTVIICLYYRDIELNHHMPYMEKNYLIVTAGRREDGYFLNRLRSFIELSDYTLSNSVGTHIGYCVALEKPHMILKQNILYNTYSDYEKADVTTLYNNLSVQEKEEVEINFSTYSENITENQLRVINKYYGLNCLKSPKEMYDILEETEKLFQKQRL